jgi:hypothetical protein
LPTTSAAACCSSCSCSIVATAWSTQALQYMALFWRSLQNCCPEFVTASSFFFIITDFASRHNDNLMVSLYLTLYRATLWRFTIVWPCCCGLRRSKHFHDPCAARLYHLLRAEVLMTSAYPLCSTGSTLVLTTGLQPPSTNPQSAVASLAICLLHLLLFPL